MGSEVTSKDQLSKGPTEAWKNRANKEYLVIEGSANMLKNALSEPDLDEDQRNNYKNQLDDLIIRSKKKSLPGVTSEEHTNTLRGIFGEYWKENKPGSRPARDV